MSYAIDEQENLESLNKTSNENVIATSVSVPMVTMAMAEAQRSALARENNPLQNLFANGNQVITIVVFACACLFLVGIIILGMVIISKFKHLK